MSSAFSEPTYLARVATLLLDDAARVGLDRAALLRRLVIDPAALENPDARVPLSTIVAIVRAVQASAEGPAFGVRAGAARKARDAGLVGYAMVHSATLRDALRRLARYGRIVGDHNRFELHEEGEAPALVFEVHPAIGAIAELVEMNVAWIVAVLREITSADVVPVEVRFTLPGTEHTQELRDHLRCPVVFESKDAAIVLRRDQLDLRVTAADATLAGYLDRLADDAMKALGDDATTTGRLRRVLWSHLAEGPPTLASAAAALAMSARTLQRRLLEEGTTFAAVLESLRRSLAVTLLRDRTLAVYEIGFLLGYADQSAFHRAFRRWEGLSPRRFRARTVVS